MRAKFKLSHSLWGTAGALALEALVMLFAPTLALAAVLCIAALGAAGNLYVATEVVEEVRAVQRMMLLLCVVLAEFVVFFAFQYHFIEKLSPASYPTLGPDAASLALQSIMVFVFNPLYIPADTAGRVLLIINTAASLGLVLFVLQNVWHLRREHPAL